MSGVSLMYVSGDSQGLDNSKLQLEICTVSIAHRNGQTIVFYWFSMNENCSANFPLKVQLLFTLNNNLISLTWQTWDLLGLLLQNDCCSSRVKYARVHREKENDVWSKTAIGPLVGGGGGARARSSWDLGSDADGSSTPGSASWGDVFGVIGRSATQWPAAGDFGFGKNQVFLDAGRGDHFDAWAACDAFLETDFERTGSELQEETGEYDQWNSTRKTFRKPQI